MIQSYRNLKKIAILDGKFYTSKDIENIEESNENITIHTKKEIVTIPKSSISRIEYYNRAVADGKQYR